MDDDELYDAMIEQISETWVKVYSEIDTILRRHRKDCHYKKYDYVYHYTTGSGLKGMLEGTKKPELILSEREYMNDVLEVNYTNKMISKHFQNLPDHNEFQYVFSTTTERDSIHMWSYYSGIDSYCLKINRKEMKKLFLEKENILNNCLFYGRVIYNRRLQNTILDEIKTAIAKMNFSATEKDRMLQLIVAYFKSFYKQEGHSCESEYRFVFSEASNKCKDYLNKRGLFVPSLKLQFEKLPIEEIILGPNCGEPQLAKKSLLLFMKKNGYTDWTEKNITVSRMKIR